MTISLGLGLTYKATLKDGREVTFKVIGGPDLAVKSDNEEVKTLNDIKCFNCIEELDEPSTQS